MRLSECSDALKAGLRLASKDWGSCGSCEQCHVLEWETTWWGTVGQSFLSGKMINHQKSGWEQDGEKEGKKAEGEWMFWEAFIFQRVFARLGSGRNRRSWTAWSRRNIWKQHGHPRGARKIATYRECTGKRVTEEANVLSSICQRCTVSCWGFSGSSMHFHWRCWFNTLLWMTHLTIVTYSTACLTAPWPRRGSSVFSAEEAAAGMLAGWSARAQAV